MLRVGLQQHPRAADRELVAFAAHGLDQHRELQLAAARDVETVAGFRPGDPDRDVALGLAPQPLPEYARGGVAALLAGERRIIRGEGHGERRRVDRLGGQSFLHLEVAQRVRNGGAIEAGERHDVAGARFLEPDPLQAPKGEDLGHACLLDRGAVAPERLDGRIRLDGA